MICPTIHIKAINDNYGHIIGDIVLQKFVELIVSQLRLSDIFGRWGGEEFIIVCPYTSINTAYSVAERLCRFIENYKMIHIDRITFSAGISQFIETDEINDMIERADSALYYSKENGRNQVTKSDFINH